MSRFQSPSAFVFYGLFAFLIVATLAARALIRSGKVGGDTAKNLMDRIWAWWVMIGVLALIFTLGAGAITLFFALCSMAARTRSRDSLTAVSARPTMVSPGSPELTSASTSTIRAATPTSTAVRHRATTTPPRAGARDWALPTDSAGCR